MININNLTYEIIEDEREGYNEEAFKARYSEILTKYDYIVGDWGYGQLRLRGFFDDTNQKATFDTKISTLSEYLYEYCNFGCPYFVVKKVKK
ncbi:YutD family protein [Peribacillus sp. NPDC097895]|uniref:YutD family protein n=1 Tax=Peribacillus sp. NPDC097895 TaxID=3390619 RepID=UPI003D02898B